MYISWASMSRRRKCKKTKTKTKNQIQGSTQKMENENKNKRMKGIRLVTYSRYLLKPPREAHTVSDAHEQVYSPAEHSRASRAKSFQSCEVVLCAVTFVLDVCFEDFGVWKLQVFKHISGRRVGGDEEAKSGQWAVFSVSPGRPGATALASVGLGRGRGSACVTGSPGDASVIWAPRWEDSGQTW